MSRWAAGRRARPRDKAASRTARPARADASRCYAGDCLTDKGSGVGTEMPLDGDGTMVEDKITIALAPSAQTEG